MPPSAHGRNVRVTNATARVARHRSHHRRSLPQWSCGRGQECCRTSNPPCFKEAVQQAVPMSRAVEQEGPPGDAARLLNGDVLWAGPWLRRLAEVECCLRLSSADALLATGHAPRDGCVTAAGHSQGTVRQSLFVRNRSFGSVQCHRATRKSFTRTAMLPSSHRSPNQFELSPLQRRPSCSIFR